MARSINAAGLALIRASEGVRLEAYQDTSGIWTIGSTASASESATGNSSRSTINFNVRGIMEVGQKQRVEPRYCRPFTR